MKKALILIACLLSMNASSVLSQSNDRRNIWYLFGVPSVWYLTPFEACVTSDHFTPEGRPQFVNPSVSNVNGGGGVFDNSNLRSHDLDRMYCYGNRVGLDESIREGVDRALGVSCDNRHILSIDEVFRHLCGTPINDTPNETLGDTCNKAGNPCNTATGNKVQTETDFAYSGLSFVRTYNSQNLIDIGSGRGWRTNYQSKLTVSGDSLILISKSGKGEPWTRVNGQWQGDADTKLIVEQSNDQFTVVYPNDRTEQYNANGQLEVQTDSNGFNTIYTYDEENQLIEVENHYGKKIQFSYLYGRIETVTDPDGVLYRYEYDGLQNLTAVVYPDLTSDTDDDNPRRIYHYEDEQFLSHLTGITDENGDRYATWSYDEEGRAISSEHAQTTNEVGQEKVELDFQ